MNFLFLFFHVPAFSGMFHVPGFIEPSWRGVCSTRKKKTELFRVCLILLSSPSIITYLTTKEKISCLTETMAKKTDSVDANVS